MNVGNITFSSTGFYDNRQNIPTGHGYLLFATLWDLDGTSGHDPIICYGNGSYLGGTAGSSATNVSVAFFYQPVDGV